MNQPAQENGTNPSEPKYGWRRPRRLRITGGLALLAGVIMLPTVGLNSAAAHPAKTNRAASSSSRARCAAALQSVEAAGLILPDGFGYRCPGDTRSYVGDGQRWGVTCYYHPTFCPDSAHIAVSPSRIGRSDARLRYVVAHEIGHAIDYVSHGSTTEESADARAGAAGFGRV